jgi:hypothetical protein
MRTTRTLTAAAAVSLFLLSACNKPASQTAADAAATTTNTAAAATDTAVNTTAAAANGATSGGGVVSPPAANGAINADANKANPDLAAASNSFTMGEAKGHIEHAGYTGVMGLTKTPDGIWTGQAMKDGKPVTVSIDFKGAVSAK